MRSRHRPTAAEVARLTIYLVIDYDKEKHKNTSRFRISSKTLRRMSGRAVLRDAFIEEWEDALCDLGWSTLRVGDYFGLIRTDTIGDWSRISSIRIKTVIEKVRNDDPDVWDEIEAILSRVAAASEENDEG